LILEWLHDGVFVCDKHGKITAVNTALCDISGYTSENLLAGDGLALLFGEPSLAKMHGKGHLHRIVRPDGTIVPIEITLNTLGQGDYIGVIYDLSARQQVQASEDKYRDLFNSANDAIMIVDVGTQRFLDVNKNAARWLGYTREELLNMTFEAIDVVEEEAEHVYRGLSNTGRLIYEQYYRRKDGSLLPVEVSSRLTKFDGRQAMLHFVRDISQRRTIEEAERNQRRLSEALRDTAAALNSTLVIDHLMHRILELVGSVVPFDAANIMQVDHDQTVVIGHRGYDKFFNEQSWSRIRLPLEATATLRWMVTNKRPICVPNTQSFRGWVTKPHQEWIKAYVAAPIIVDNAVIGFINLDGTRIGQFTQQQADHLMAFANQAGIALQNARLFQQVQNHAVQLEQRVTERTAELVKANTVLTEQMRERERAEKALAEERTLLWTLIDNIPDEIYVKDVAGRFMLVNRALQNRMLKRYPEMNLLGKTDHDLQGPNPLHDDELSLFESGESIVNQEMMSITEDGNKRWLLVTKVPLRDPQSEIVGLVGINRDITDLRGMEEQLLHVVTGANCLLWHATVEQRDHEFLWNMYVSSESAANRFLPLVIGENETYVHAWQRSILSSDYNRVRTTSLTALTNNFTNYSQEFRCRRADGEIRWLYEEVRIRLLTPNRWSLVGVCTDITERKEATDALQSAYDALEQRVAERTAELSKANQVLKEQIAERQRAEKALRESEARFRALVEHAPEAIVVFDVFIDRYIDVNQNASELFGLERKQLLLYGPFDFCPKYQPNGANSNLSMRAKIQEAVNGGTPVFEWVYLNSQQQEIPCEVRLLLLPTSGELLIRGSITDITERRRAQLALAESEEKYRSLTNQLPLGIYRTDREGILVHANPALAAILGYDQVDQVIGSSLLPFYENQIERRKFLTDFNSGENPVIQGEFELTAQDGRDLWVRDTGRIILNFNNEVDYIDGILEDISDNKRAQQAEQEQRQLARALQDAAADLNRTLDLDEVLDRILKHIMRVMPPHEKAGILLLNRNGYSARNIRYLHKQEGIERISTHEMSDFREIPNLHYMYETGSPVYIGDTESDPRWVKSNTTLHVRSYIGAPIRSEGQVIGFINLESTHPQVFNEDYAARLLSFANQVGIAIQNARLYEESQIYARNLQQLVEERTAELNTERLRLYTILNAMTEGVMYYDQHNVTLFTNSSLWRLTGYKDEEWRSQAVLNQIFQLSSAKQRIFWQDVEEVLSLSGVWRNEVKIQRKDGAEFDAAVVISRVVGAEGQSVGSVIVLRDISQQKQLDRQRTSFIANASHELRTPVTNIKTRLYLIRRQPERLEDHLKILESVTERMKKLVEDLFDLSRFEHGILPIERQVVKLQDLLSEISSIQQPEAERKQIDLTLRQPTETVLISVDPPRFTQVITNLLTNAINYTSSGGKIDLEAEINADQVIILVRDTGIGIAADALEQIFKPFYRGTEASTGAGLGLSISKEIIELHGGQITVNSEVGVGTCFRVMLNRVYR
jgi:PAS domain S-box-containing protein